MLMADLIFFSLCTFQLHFRMMVRKLMMRMLRRRYQIEMWAVDVGTPQARWQEKPIAKPAKVWQADKHLFQLSTHSELKSGFNETCLRNFSVRFLGWSTGSTCSRSVGYVRSTTSSNSSSSSIAERCGFAGTGDNIGHIDNTIHQLATGSDDCFYSWHVSLTCKLNSRKLKRSCMLVKSEFHDFAYFASFFLALLCPFTQGDISKKSSHKIPCRTWICCHHQSKHQLHYQTWALAWALWVAYPSMPVLQHCQEVQTSDDLKKFYSKCPRIFVCVCVNKM